MSGTREYSYEEAMSLTLQDVQDPNFVSFLRIKGWLELSQEQQDECLSKLRDLVQQREAQEGSNAVDASELEAKLERLACPHPPTPPLDPEADMQRRLDEERDFRKALIDAHGRPCYPVEEAPAVYECPGEYKEIMRYWDPYVQGALSIGYQLRRWTAFRESQQRIRDSILPLNGFVNYVQGVMNRRRKHGLNGDVRLLEDREKQSDIGHWIEYQDYELREFETYEARLEKGKAELAANRKELAEAGITAYEEIQNPGFGEFYQLSMSHNREIGPVEASVYEGKKKLKLAERRLDAAKSGELDELIEKEDWIQVFQRRLDASSEKLKAVPSFSNDDWLPGGKRYILDAHDDSERRQKTRAELMEHHTVWWEAERLCRCAKTELQAAQADEFGGTLHRAELVEIVLAEIQTAQEQIQASRKKLEPLKLKEKVVGALGSIAAANMDIERHRILLDWIENERGKMVNELKSIDRNGSKTQTESTILHGEREDGNSGQRNSSEIGTGRKLRSHNPVSKLTEASKRPKPTHEGPSLKDQKKFSRGPTSRTSRNSSSSNFFQPDEVDISKPKSSVPAQPSKRPTRVSNSHTRRKSHKSQDTTRQTQPAFQPERRQPNGLPLRRSLRVSKPPDRYSP